MFEDLAQPEEIRVVLSKNANTWKVLVSIEGVFQGGFREKSLRKCTQKLPSFLKKLKKKVQNVKEARKNNVCRICGKKPDAIFIYNMGREHAHEMCLNKKIKKGTPK